MERPSEEHPLGFGEAFAGASSAGGSRRERSPSAVRDAGPRDRRRPSPSAPPRPSCSSSRSSSSPLRRQGEGILGNWRESPRSEVGTRKKLSLSSPTSRGSIKLAPCSLDGFMKQDIAPPSSQPTNRAPPSPSPEEHSTPVRAVRSARPIRIPRRPVRVGPLRLRPLGFGRRGPSPNDVARALDVAMIREDLEGEKLRQNQLRVWSGLPCPPDCGGSARQYGDPSHYPHYPCIGPMAYATRWEGPRRADLQREACVKEGAHQADPEQAAAQADRRSIKVLKLAAMAQLMLGASHLILTIAMALKGWE